MKRFFALWSLFGLLLACALVGYATVRQAGPNASLDGLLAAQSHTPSLLALDAAALYILVSCALFTLQQRHAAFGEGEVGRLREEHRAQLEAMLINTAKLEETNANQADLLTEQEAEIAAQQERIKGLTAQTATLQAEIDARQEAFEAEARRLTEQAFRAISGQVDANARQLDAVNVALSYHRAELQQLRRSLRGIDPGAETDQFAPLNPAELTAIAAPDPGSALVPSNADAEAAEISYLVSVPTLNAPSTVIPDILHFGLFSRENTPVVELPIADPPETASHAEIPHSEMPQTTERSGPLMPVHAAEATPHEVPASAPEGEPAHTDTSGSTKLSTEPSGEPPSKPSTELPTDATFDALEAVDAGPNDTSDSTEPLSTGALTGVTPEESMFLLAPMLEHPDLPSSLPTSSNHLNTPQDHADPLPPPLSSAPNIPDLNQSRTDTPPPNAPSSAPIAPTGWQRKL